MKKTHSANIGGTVFHIEEDAYEKLLGYLQSIQTHFHFYPDVADIVADIEARIAEQLAQHEGLPQIVRMSDVERVIEAMGRIEQFDEPAPEPALPRQPRKLFRDPDNKVIAGVAGGLASYLGLPPLLVRLVFLLLLAFFGVALVAYLLLWVLMPLASSTTDKLQMRGRPVTLASIDQGVRDSLTALPTATRGALAQAVLGIGSLIHLVVVSVARAIRWVAGVTLVGGATMGILFLTVLLVVALVNASAPPLHPDVAAFLAVFGSWQHLFKALLYLLAVIPLVLVIALVLRSFWGKRRIATRAVAGLLGVWVVALLATAFLWSSHYPGLHQFWDEYPAVADARQRLERFAALAAPTAPLSEAQSNALLATLVAEYKRREASGDHRRYYAYDPAGWVAFEEQKLLAIDESNRRILESARAFLDGNQLALIEESMAEDSARRRSVLQARVERLESRMP